MLTVCVAEPAVDIARPLDLTRSSLAQIGLKEALQGTPLQIVRRMRPPKPNRGSRSTSPRHATSTYLLFYEPHSAAILPARPYRAAAQLKAVRSLQGRWLR